MLREIGGGAGRRGDDFWSGKVMTRNKEVALSGREGDLRCLTTKVVKKHGCIIAIFSTTTFFTQMVLYVLSWSRGGGEG